MELPSQTCVGLVNFDRGEFLRYDFVAHYVGVLPDSAIAVASIVVVGFTNTPPPAPARGKPTVFRWPSHLQTTVSRTGHFAGRMITSPETSKVRRAPSRTY